MPDQLSVEEFLCNAEDLQLRDGGGEWDVLVYAVDSPDQRSRVTYPFGRDNPYRRLRTDRGCRVQLLANFDYMRWTYYTFTISRPKGRFETEGGGAVMNVYEP